MTLGECLQAEAALGRIGAQHWPVKTAYHLAKLLRLLRVHTQRFEEVRLATIKELGTARAATELERQRGADAEVFEVPPAKLADYLRRHRELRDEPVTLAWAPVQLVEFGADARVSSIDLADLGPVLADEPEVDGREA